MGLADRTDRPVGLVFRARARRIAVRRHVRRRSAGALRAAAVPGVGGGQRACHPGTPRRAVRAPGGGVSRRAAGVAPRDAGTGVGARIGAPLRRLRADVDPAVFPDRVPEA